MSRFFSERHSQLTPYVPGEQPSGRQYIKLNTNESPYPPSPGVMRAVTEEAGQLNRYCDPAAAELTKRAAAFYGVSPEQVLMTNGSDDILNFAFLAAGDEAHPFVFPDITYFFYETFCRLHRIPYRTIPLREDFSVDYRDYCDVGANVALPNPNAPSGLALPVAQLEEIIRSNPDHLVIIDEAYVDFGGESALGLLPKYDNLLVTRTFSKSRSLAGARLGFGIGSPEFIADLNTLKYSTNPYCVNRMTAAAGIAALDEDAYYTANVRAICQVRDETAEKLRALGCLVTESRGNFLFVEVPGRGGADMCAALRDKGILVRRWDRPRIENRMRITVGTQEEMDALVKALEEII